jgi:hypothetical protein
MIPTKKLFQDDERPIRIKVVFKTEMMSTPKNVPKTVPLPPVNFAPPRTVAAIIVSSSPTKEIGFSDRTSAA